MNARSKASFANSTMELLGLVKWFMGSIIGTITGVLFILVASGLKLDREYQRGVIFRLGRVRGTMGPGMY